MQDLNDKVTGSTLTAAEWNEVPSEIQNVITALGITLSSGDLNQLGKAIAGYVANGQFYSESGLADAYVLSGIGAKQTAPSYIDGFFASFIAGNANTGPSTVNIAGLGVKDIKLSGGTDPAADDISGRVEIIYDAGNDWFELLSPNVTGRTIEFKTIQEMVDFTGSLAGMKMRTLGYITENDGGGNTFVTRSVTAADADEGSLIKSVGNVAVEFVGTFPGGVVNPKQFGFTDLAGEFDDYKGFSRAMEYAIVNKLEITGLDLEDRKYVIRDDKRIYDQDDNEFTIKGVSLFDFLLVSFEARTTYNIRPGLTPTESKSTGFSRIQWINPDYVEEMIQRVVDDGCNIIRVGVDPANENAPEQTAADAKLYPSEMQMLDTIIYYATKYNLVVLLRQGRKDATASEFSDFMDFLVQRYSRFQNVWYNPENEINGGITNDVPTWVADIETYLTSMRAAGCVTPIVINATQFGGQAGLVDVLPAMDASSTISGDPNLAIGFHVYQLAAEDEGYVNETRQSEQEDAVYRAYGRYAIFIEETGISNNLVGGIDPILDLTDPDDPQSALFKSNQLQEWMREYMRWTVREVQEGHLLGCIATTYGAYIPGSDKHDANSLRVFGKDGEPNDDFKLSQWGEIYLDYFLKTPQTTADNKGQVRLEVIGSTVTLSRYNGANLMINHRIEQLENAGKTISSAGVPQDVISWIYAQLDSNGLIELVATQTAPEFDPISGVWVEPVASIITGASTNRYDDLPRTLVGMAYKVAAGFRSTLSQRLVRSWFNRQNLRMEVILTPQVNKTTIEDIADLKIEFLLWRDEAVEPSTRSGISTTAAGNVTYRMQKNGVNAFPDAVRTLGIVANEMMATEISVGDEADTYYDIQVQGGVSAGTVTFKQDARLKVIIGQ